MHSHFNKWLSLQVKQVENERKDARDVKMPEQSYAEKALANNAWISGVLKIIAAGANALPFGGGLLAALIETGTNCLVEVSADRCMLDGMQTGKVR